MTMTGLTPFPEDALRLMPTTSDSPRKGYTEAVPAASLWLRALMMESAKLDSAVVLSIEKYLQQDM